MGDRASSQGKQPWTQQTDSLRSQTMSSCPRLSSRQLLLSCEKNISQNSGIDQPDSIISWVIPVMKTFVCVLVNRLWRPDPHRHLGGVRGSWGNSSSSYLKHQHWGYEYLDNGELWRKEKNVYNQGVDWRWWEHRGPLHDVHLAPLTDKHNVL